MPDLILSAGVACVIAALVGGGLKAFSIEIPLLSSTKRQWSLGLFGLMLMALYLSSHEQRHPSQQTAPVDGQPDSSALPDRGTIDKVQKGGRTMVELHSPAVSPSGALIQDIGIETLGGVFMSVVGRGCRVPCSTTRVFSTADDGKSEILLKLLRGIASMSKDAHRLGIYAIVGIPAESRGETSVAVTFTVSGDHISIEAFDNHAKRPLRIERREP